MERVHGILIAAIAKPLSTRYERSKKIVLDSPFSIGFDDKLTLTGDSFCNISVTWNICQSEKIKNK